MKHVQYFSVLRAFSCLAIVVLHTFWTAYNIFQPTGATGIASMIIRNCMEWAVPCFVMISGALLLDPEREIPFSKIFNKYIRRVVLALLIFSFVFEIFDVAVDHQVQGFGIITDWLLKLYTRGSWLHMWYLYMIIGLYLMLPIYRTLIRHCSWTVYGYMMILYFIFLALVPTLNILTNTTFGVYFMVYTVYPFYFFLGYGIHHRKVNISTRTAWILVAVSTVVIILVTYFGVSRQNQTLVSLGNSYAFVAVVTQAMGVFALMKKAPRLSGRAYRFLAAIDKNSFGIYLIHVLVLYVFFRAMHFNPFLHGGILMLVILAAVVAVISWAAIWVLKKIPFIRTIV